MEGLARCGHVVFCEPVAYSRPNVGMKKGPELVFSSPGLVWLLAVFCRLTQYTRLNVRMQPLAAAVVLTCPL